ncbi:MAG: MarR family transcriptional regulator [Bilophila wadsworthia]|uniref:MarR family winged helix-turn-helix transcriptional regulator n=2 Tax=Bilophila wadsworthia TaxID=35833 RepID=UPI00300F3C4D
MYDTEKAFYRHYEYIQKENSLYSRWFQKRGLSYPQFLILDAVLRRPEGAEPTALAEECFMPKQTVTGLLDQLERAGFIRRERCETDRRRTRVFCLPAGDVFVTGIMEELDRHEQAALASISAEDMETFNNVYAAIVDGLEKHLFPILREAFHACFPFRLSTARQGRTDNHAHRLSCPWRWRVFVGRAGSVCQGSARP